MYININQNVNSAEPINYKIIELLYNLSNKYNSNNDYIQYIGNLITNYSYSDSRDYLILKYNNLFINILIENYLRIDPEVFKIFMENNISSDGEGITLSDFNKQINTSLFYKFNENEYIIDCTSFQYFTNIEGDLLYNNGPFYNCINLKRIILPQPIKKLKKVYYSSHGIFEGCTSLEYCKIMNSTVTDLGTFTFFNCTNPNLKIDLNNSPINTLNSYCFKEGKFKNLESLFINYDFNNLQTIGQGALEYNTELESFTLYSNIKYIGAYTFAGCTNLTSFIVEENGVDVEFMGATMYGPTGSIFYQTNISRIDFYSRVTKMSNLVFGNITTELIFRNTTPPVCQNGSDSVFRHFQGKIYVPDNLIETYKTADGFSNVANKIYGISELL